MMALWKFAAAMVIIGSSVVTNKLVVGKFPVFLASELRLSIGAAVLLGLAYARHRRLPRLSRQDWRLAWMLSFVGMFLFSLLLLYGVRASTAMDSGLLSSTTPLFVGLISLLFFREKLTVSQSAGILCALGGAVILQAAGQAYDGSWSWNRIGGSLLVIGAVAGEAVYMTFMKRMSPDAAALDVAAAVIALGALWFLPFAGYEMLRFDWRQTDWGDWRLIGYNGIVVTVAANLLISGSMPRLSAASAAPWTALMPASAVALSVLVLHETLAWYHAIGMILIVSGIRIANRKEVMKNAG